MPINRKLTLVLLVFVLAPFVAAGQALADQAATDRSASFDELIEVSEVLLDVLVTDRKGQVIVGLTPEDFVISEEGREIPLSGASFYSNRILIRDDDPSRVKKAAADEVPADRYFVFFIHDQLRTFGATSPLVRRQFEAAQQIRRWIKREMLPGDWVAVVSYDVKLKVHQDFTRNRELLQRALDHATMAKDPQNIWGSRRPESPEGHPSLLSNLPEGKEMRDQTTRIYDGMRLLAEATQGIVGRKNLVLFSTGFGRIDTSLGAPVALPDDRFYPDLRQSLNDNNVAVYSVDLSPNGFETAQANFLTKLSTETGGEYYGTFSSFITPLRKIADEANGYYLLSYQAEHPAGETGYRKVKVKTRNPDFKVRARQGYRYGS